MPLTPFHLGPAVAIYAASNRKLFFWAIAAGAILPDLDGLLFLATGWGGLHGVLHSFIGAFLLSTAAFLAYGALNNDFERQKVVFYSFLAGDLLGHVFLDALIYPELPWFWPLEGNPFAKILSYDQAVFLSVFLFIAGAAVLLFQTRFDKGGGK